MIRENMPLNARKTSVCLKILKNIKKRFTKESNSSDRCDQGKNQITEVITNFLDSSDTNHGYT